MTVYEPPLTASSDASNNSRIKASLFWLSLEKGLRLVLNTIFGILIARYLGPGDFGILNYSLTWVFFLGIIASLGIDSVLVQEVIHTPQESNCIVGTSFFLKFISSSVLFFLALKLLCSNFSSKSEWEFVLRIALFSLLLLPFEVIDYWFQSLVEAKFPSIAKITSLLLASLLKLVFLLFGGSLLAFAWLTVLENAFLAAGLAFAYWLKSQSTFHWRFWGEKAKVLWKKAFPLLLASISNIIFLRFDIIFLGHCSSEDLLGNYCAATKISEMWGILPVIVSSTFLPLLVKERLQDGQLFQAQFQKLLDIFTCLSVATALVITFFSPQIILLLFGERFPLAANILSIHVWTIVFMSMGVISSSWYLVEDLNAFLFFRSAGGAIINILLNLLLTPTFSVWGAAISAVAAQAWAAFFCDLLWSKTRKVFFMKARSFIGFVYYFRQRK